MTLASTPWRRPGYHRGIIFGLLVLLVVFLRRMKVLHDMSAMAWDVLNWQSADGTTIIRSAKQPTPLPPLESVLDERGRVVGDVSTVVDFAVIGFPKCGTTSMGVTLATVAATPGGDTCSPLKGLLAMYHEWKNMTGDGTRGQEANHLLRGFKCPRTLEKDFDMLQQLGAKTRLMVGVRHPVRWFESFYNMGVQNSGRLPPPIEFIGTCQGKKGAKRLMCTDRARFHVHLSQLGKTPLSPPERELLRVAPGEIPRERAPPRQRRRARGHIPEVNDSEVINPIFLYETSQLGDDNETRRTLFWDDVAQYIGLERGSIRNPIHVKPGKANFTTYKQSIRDRNKLDVCDEAVAPLRAVLMQHAREGGRWLRKYFLREGRGVYMSSREHLLELLEKWEDDPCDRTASD